MEVQKIANFKQRMQEYRDDRRQFWLKDFVFISVVGAVVCFGGIYGLTRIGLKPDYDWRATALFLWIVMLILPVKMMHPEKPDPSDVLRDQALRRAGGVDDTVEE